MLRPIIILILAGIAYIVSYLHKNKKLRFLKKEKVKDNNLETVQEFVNVIDIKKNCLYTRDNKVFTYIRIYPIDINLLSKRERRTNTNILTREISVIQKSFKFLAVSKPTDISSLVGEYHEMLHTSHEQKQKELLRKEMLALSDFVTAGEVTERMFYITVWEDYEEDIETELAKYAHDFASAYATVGVHTEILNEKEIYRLCNMVNNPGYSNEDIDVSFTPIIPVLKEAI